MEILIEERSAVQATFRKLRSVRIGGQAAASGVLLFVGSEAHAAMPGSQTSTAADPAAEIGPGSAFVRNLGCC